MQISHIGVSERTIGPDDMEWLTYTAELLDQASLLLSWNMVHTIGNVFYTSRKVYRLAHLDCSVINWKKNMLFLNYFLEWGIIKSLKYMSTYIICTFCIQFSQFESGPAILSLVHPKGPHWIRSGEQPTHLNSLVKRLIFHISENSKRQAILAFQESSTLHMVLTPQVGYFPILSIMRLWSFKGSDHNITVFF